MKIKYKKLNENALPPYKATKFSAGTDIFALLEKDIIIKPCERVLIPTGLSLEIPAGFGGFLFPRSSLSSKFGITLSNSVGVIDADYRGEVKIAMINQSKEEFLIKNHDRVAQLVILAVPDVDYELSEELLPTIRGEGGFGSTGR